MKFNILKSRKGILESELNNNFGDVLDSHKIEKIMELFDEYEKNNLTTIEKLKKEKLVTTKKINGALRQTIQAHGPITMVLIGSASKRIYGSLLSNPPKNKKVYRKSFLCWLFLGVLITIILGFFL